VSTTDYDTIRTERLGDWLLWHARNPEALDNLQARALKALKHGDEEAVKAALLDFVDACTPPVGNWWRPGHPRIPLSVVAGELGIDLDVEPQYGGSA
jgi:hypothetical protein